MHTTAINRSEHFSLTQNKLALSVMVALGAVAALVAPVLADEGELVRLNGAITAESDVSAAVRIGALLALGADEGSGDDELNNQVDLLKQDGSGEWSLVGTVLLARGTEKSPELDLEGLATDGTNLYAIGSHSRKRPRLKRKKTIKANRKRLEEDAVKRERTREQLIRIRIGDDGQAETPELLSLSDLFDKDNVLDPFRKFASKENGIDIEGLAFHDGLLYLGFRGPVLRGNYVPVMVFDFDQPEDYALRFVRLGGRGIRSIETVGDGFLLIAGPLGDGEDGYRLVHWDGRDMVPGSDAPTDIDTAVSSLREIPVPPGGKAEGLALLEETSDAWTILIVYDGIETRDNLVRKFTVPKP